MRYIVSCWALFFCAVASYADITWRWQFSTESGTFVTGGNQVAGAIAPGTYTIDVSTFSVSASQVPSLIGATFSETQAPQDIVWDGNSVTQFRRAGGSLTNGSNFFSGVFEITLDTSGGSVSENGSTTVTGGELLFEPVLPTLFVWQTATGSNDGSSWDDAFMDLPDALASATAGTQIWVAEGTYYPDLASAGVATVTADDPAMSFQVSGDIQIFGGFQGDETFLSQRTPNDFLTTLSGDLGQDDQFDPDPAIAIQGTNSAHVVTVSGSGSNIAIDGLIITGGNAVASDGAGLQVDAATLGLKNCEITGNNSSGTGGGIYIANNATVSAENCIFTANRAMNGGGIGVLAGSTLTISQALISENIASTAGGGLFFEDAACDLTATIVIANQSTDGGGIHLQGTSAALVLTCRNVSISNNSAGGNGGAINLSGGGADLTNLTLSGNSAGISAGGIAVGSGAQLDTKNSILWNNRENGSNTATGSSAVLAPGAISQFRSSLIANSGGSGAGWNTAAFGTDGGSNLDTDPKFFTDVDPDVPQPNGDLQLRGISPAVNTGDNTFVTTGTDIAGNPRITPVSSGVDMGASEFQGFQSLIDKWRQTFDLAIDGSDDLTSPAGDGVTNLLKFAYNIGAPSTVNFDTVNPVFGTSGMPFLERDGDHFIVSFVRPVDVLGSSGVDILVQANTDLLSASWVDIDNLPGASVSTVVTPISGGEYEHVRLTVTTSEPRTFVRVGVDNFLGFPF